MTGNMLFEIIDPFLMWKQIYIAVRDTINGSEPSEVPFNVSRVSASPNIAPA